MSFKLLFWITKNLPKNFFFHKICAGTFCFHVHYKYLKGMTPIIFLMGKVFGSQGKRQMIIQNSVEQKHTWKVSLFLVLVNIHELLYISNRNFLFALDVNIVSECRARCGVFFPNRVWIHNENVLSGQNLSHSKSKQSKLRFTSQKLIRISIHSNIMSVEIKVVSRLLLLPKNQILSIRKYLINFNWHHPPMKLIF